MSARVKLSSAAIWFALAFTVFATSFVANLNGLLYNGSESTDSMYERDLQ